MWRVVGWRFAGVAETALRSSHGDAHQQEPGEEDLREAVKV